MGFHHLAAAPTEFFADSNSTIEQQHRPSKRERERNLSTDERKAAYEWIT
jgi:hypothetical protein